MLLDTPCPMPSANFPKIVREQIARVSELRSRALQPAAPANNRQSTTTQHHEDNQPTQAPPIRAGRDPGRRVRTCHLRGSRQSAAAAQADLRCRRAWLRSAGHSWQRAHEPRTWSRRASGLAPVHGLGDSDAHSTWSHSEDGQPLGEPASAPFPEAGGGSVESGS